MFPVVEAFCLLLEEAGGAHGVVAVVLHLAEDAGGDLWCGILRVLLQDEAALADEGEEGCLAPRGRWG